MAIKKFKDEELWITNISRVKDVGLSDLRITVRKGQSINLLAKNKKGRSRWNFTKEQLEKSIKEGSIFKKSNLIKIRKVPPVVFSNRIDIKEAASDRDSMRLNRPPTEIEVEEFPDLDFNDSTDNFSEEKYAAENADMDFIDRAPAIPVDPKFKNLLKDDE